MLNKMDVSCRSGVAQTRLEKIYKNLVRFLVITKNNLILMSILLPIVKPDMPVYVTSLIYCGKSPSPLARVMYALPIIYLTFTWWSNLFFMLTWLLGYIFSILVAFHNPR